MTNGRGKWKRPSLAERFATKYEIAENGCWLWKGSRLLNGYGTIWSEGRMVYAHRVSYSLAYGPIPAGLTVDHLCHNADSSCSGGRDCQHRRCVNPAHLGLATPQENTSRGLFRRTHCSKGHEYVPETTSYSKEGWRRCLICDRDWQRRRYHERTAA